MSSYGDIYDNLLREECEAMTNDELIESMRENKDIYTVCRDILDRRNIPRPRLIQDLPREVINEIVSHLAPESLVSARRASPIFHTSTISELRRTRKQLQQRLMDQKERLFQEWTQFDVSLGRPTKADDSREKDYVYITKYALKGLEADLRDYLHKYGFDIEEVDRIMRTGYRFPSNEELNRRFMEMPPLDLYP